MEETVTAHSYLRAASRTDDREPTGVHQPDITGLKVLVLEDDPLFAMAMEGMLLDLGCIVHGPYGDLAEAADFIRAHHCRIDVAILDINIHGEMSFGLAERLIELDVPFFFCTGYEKAAIDPRWRNWPNVGKFFTETGLIAMLDRQVSEHRLAMVRR